MSVPRLTRRKLVALVAALPAAAQQPPAQPPPLPANAEEELKAVQAQFQGAADQLAKTPLPMTTEPATHFKA
jgi:hypothetical protein